MGALKWAMLLTAVRDELRLGDLRAGAQHHECLDRLSPLLVGHADHRHLGDGGVLVEAVLDLDGGHVLTTGDDDVLLAVGNHQVRPSRYPPSPVWNQPPASAVGRLLGLLPVPGEDVVGAGQDLPLVVEAI